MYNTVYTVQKIARLIFKWLCYFISPKSRNLKAGGWSAKLCIVLRQQKTRDECRDFVYTDTLGEIVTYIYSFSKIKNIRFADDFLF